MAATEPATLRLARAQGVLRVELHRPETRNAMSLQMVQELGEVLRAAEADDAVRVLLLRGAGGHFCSGADLRDMAAARGRLAEDPAAISKVNAAFGQLCAEIAASPLAVVAVLEGSVMGAGLGLACAADVALCEREASFRLPETALGLVPAQIAPLLLERVGYSQAKRLAVTGGRISGDEAAAIGLVHSVHEGGAALEAAQQAVIADILRCAPGAIGATKALLARSRWQTPLAMVADAAEVFSRAALGSEGVEGLLAFMHKRAPAWLPAGASP
jgi:isohexenylglutaconyl-CoA hydratase